MSIIEHVRFAPARQRQQVRPERPTRAAAWAGAPAALVALILVWLRNDLGRSALVAATVSMLVCLFVERIQRMTGDPWNTVRLVVVGVGAGVVAGVVGARAGAGSPLLTTISQLVLGWTTVVLVSRHSEVDARTDRIAAGVIGVIVLAAASLATGVGERSVVALAIALPVGLAFFVLGSARPQPLREPASPAIGAVFAGLLAAALATLSVGSYASKGQLAASLCGTMGVLGVVLMFRTGHGRSSWWSTGLFGLALVSAGAGPAPATLIALVVVVAVEARRRPATLPVTYREPTTQRSARRIVVWLAVLAASVRAVAPRGLWLDETTQVHQARLPFVEMLRQLYLQDNHPPLSHIVSWIGIRAVGDSEFAVRLPSLVFGVLLVPLLYVTAREFYNNRVGLIAAAIGAVAPLAVWYGQEARMYSQFMLLSLVTVYAQIRVLRGGGRRYWILFTLGSVALIATQYFAVLHVGATLIVFVVELLRRRRAGQKVAALVKNLGWSTLSMAILLAPLVPFALHQTAHNQQAGFGFSAGGLATGSAVVPPPGIYGLLTNIEWAIFGYQPDQLTTRLVALWPIGLLGLLLLLGRPRRPLNRSLVIIAGFPVVVIFAASFLAAKSRSLAEVRYFAGSVPVLFVLLAAGLTTVVTSQRMQIAAVGGLLASMFGALALQEQSSSNPRLYQYREAVGFVRDRADRGDVVIYAPSYLNYTLEYYDPGVTAVPIGVDPATPTDALRKDGVSEAIAAQPRRVFVLEGSSFAESDTATSDVSTAIKSFENLGMTVQAKRSFARITVWELS